MSRFMFRRPSPVSDPEKSAKYSPARSEVERLLLAHPDVIDACLIDEEGPDGRCYPVAYVVPHAERMKEAKKRIYLADRDKRIAQWRKAFDQVYRSGPDDHAPTFVGWTSSYTNKPLPESEMREWLDCTVERILSLKPDKLLEIGCGVGLLTRELAPRCSVYRGTDLSPIAVLRLREFAASKAELRHVDLHEREATDLDGLAPKSVDTVVINSVIQYFPDIDYLRAVLDEAARVVSPGGRIFVGDVRDLGSLALFHGAVQLAKAPSKASARWLKRKVAMAIEQDRELVIDPQFFRELANSDPRISSVEILLKHGHAHNEITRYRYDVILHIGDTSRSDGRRPTQVANRDEPNRRLASDIAGVRRLWSAGDRELVEDIRRSATPAIDRDNDPEDFWKLAETSRRGRLATDPLEVAFMQQLGVELGQLLSEQLPESQLPAAVLAMNVLPSGEAPPLAGSIADLPRDGDDLALRQMIQA